MKYLLFLLIIFPVVSYAQDTATVTILVTDFKDKPKSGEKILFQNLHTKEEYSGTTGANGKFDIRLPGSAKYMIKISAIGKDQDYSELEIPALNEGEVYDKMQLTLKFEPSKEFTLDNVHFESGKASLTKISYVELNELVELLHLKETIRIEIHGHTDDVGDPEANLKLSQARAESVKAYLVSKKIESGRIIAKGFGETRPIAHNDSDEGRKKNRRTEVKIVSE